MSSEQTGKISDVMDYTRRLLLWYLDLLSKQRNRLLTSEDSTLIIILIKPPEKRRQQMFSLSEHHRTDSDPCLCRLCFRVWKLRAASCRSSLDGRKKMWMSVTEFRSCCFMFVSENKSELRSANVTDFNIYFNISQPTVWERVGFIKSWEASQWKIHRTVIKIHSCTWFKD